MSKFAKRHYEAIATVLQSSKPENNPAVEWQIIRDNLTRMFLNDNANFDVGRFQRACEPGANVRARNG